MSLLLLIVDVSPYQLVAKLLHLLTGASLTKISLTQTEGLL